MQLRLVRAERRKAAVLTPPKSRQFEASLRRDFDIQLNEFSDRKLRDISTALLIRLTYLLRILASVEGVVATAASFEVRLDFPPPYGSTRTNDDACSATASILCRPHRGAGAAQRD